MRPYNSLLFWPTLYILGRLPRCVNLSDTYELAVTAFAARRLDISYRLGFWAEIFKGSRLGF